MRLFILGMKTGRFALAAAFALLLTAPPAWAGPVVTQLVVFGDSLVDTGNLFAASGGTVPPSPPYFQGHFSNGPLWVEDLASRLGVPNPSPFLNPSGGSGTNYAFGGATTGSQFDVNGVPNVLRQVGLFLAGNTPQPGQLFVLTAGANDIFNGQTNPAVPVANLSAAIQALSRAGASEFLVANLPLLGETPFGRSLPPDQRAGLDALSAAFNVLLDGELNSLQAGLGVSIHKLDLAGLIAGALVNPAMFGFTNVTDAALFDGVLSGQGYLFWDSVHPTAQAGQVIAGRALDAVIPEPGTLSLLGAGVLGLACGRKRQRGRGQQGVSSRHTEAPASISHGPRRLPPS
jgi:phospholipase/lecithinase/hemolysin